MCTMSVLIPMLSVKCKSLHTDIVWDVYFSLPGYPDYKILIQMADKASLLADVVFLTVRKMSASSLG